MDSPQQYQYEQERLSEKENSEHEDLVDIEIENEIDYQDFKIQEIIYPFRVYYDDNYNRIFFNNELTQESLWNLPQYLIKKIKQYVQQQKEQKEQKQAKQITQYLSQEEIDKNEGIYEIYRQLMNRPARKQLQISLAEQFAYKQGELEYNVWYDKFLSDSNDRYKTKEQAVTKCDPFNDVGYTKADIESSTFNKYVCIHFIRGCCNEGVNCKYYHRIPSIEMMETIENTKDVFGRNRHTNYREDKTGIGIFSENNKSIVVSEYKGVVNTQSVNYTQSIYELLMRHFGVWGVINDIFMIPFQGSSIIQYKHRCMAELAKEAMMLRGLDDDEIITIKWATSEQLQQVDQNHQYKVNLEQEKLIVDKVNKKIKKHKTIKDRFTYQPVSDKINQYHKQLQNQNKKKNKKIIQNCQKMAEILARIDCDQDDLQDDEHELSNMPLQFNQ